MEDFDTYNKSSDEIYKTFSEEERSAIDALDAKKSFQKGYVLISEGQYFKTSFHVLSGLVREFRIVDGVEITSNFYTKDQFINISNSTSSHKASAFTLICMEDSMLSVVSFEKEKEMYKQFPRFEKMCRINSEKQLNAFQDKFSKFISSTPEERYKTLLKERPDLLNRVPQYHLSSYLGITPESLSRIRKRLVEK